MLMSVNERLAEFRPGRGLASDGVQKRDAGRAAFLERLHSKRRFAATLSVLERACCGAKTYGANFFKSESTRLTTLLSRSRITESCRSASMSSPVNALSCKSPTAAPNKMLAA